VENIKTPEVIDIRQTQEYANYLKKEGWKVARIENTNYFIKKLPLIGSILKIQRPEEINFKTIKKLCQKYRVFQVIVEPISTTTDGTIKHNLFISHGYKLSKSPYLPSKTLQIDLATPLKFDKETRRCIRIGDRVKIKKCSTPSDLIKFHNAWRKSVKFTRFAPSLESLINLQSAFSIHKPTILTSHNVSSSIIGGAIFTRSLHDCAYYWQGFTNKEGRSSLSQYSLVYQGLLWAKKVGCKVFDFEGIYDERFPNKSWLGFTHFKKSFGGKEVNFPGCYTKWIFPRFT